MPPTPDPVMAASAATYSKWKGRASRTGSQTKLVRNRNILPCVSYRALIRFSAPTVCYLTSRKLRRGGEGGGGEFLVRRRRTIELNSRGWDLEKVWKLMTFVCVSFLSVFSLFFFFLASERHSSISNCCCFYDDENFLGILGNFFTSDVSILRWYRNVA